MLRLAFILRSLYQGPIAAFAFMQQDLLEKARADENFLRYERNCEGEAFMMRKVVHALEDAKTVSELVKAEKMRPR